MLANRLSEDGRHTVLVLEHGGSDRSILIRMPGALSIPMSMPRYDWGYTTEPEPHLGGRRLALPRGKVLGGSSSINGLVYVRGQPEDYDYWRQLGNPGWGWQDVLPFFKYAEDFPEGDPAWHGRGGPLGVSGPTFRMELMDAFVEAAEEAGIPHNPDYNGATQEGCGYFLLTIRNGRRASAARAYLRPARKRPNLEVRTEALTHRVLLEGKRAVGVEYAQYGRVREARAAREVVICAGAVQSPLILMLSGIGPAEHLQEKGVEVRHDLPGVGQNLQDHFQARCVYRCPLPVTLNDIGNSLLRRGLVGVRWFLTRKGPLTVGAGVVTLFWRTRPEVATPDVQFHVIPFSAEKPGEPLHPFSGFTVSVCQLRPESRGAIRLKDASPTSPPAIHPNYLATETDRRTMVDGMRLIRRVMAQRAIARYVEAEVTPGPECASDDDLLAYVRNKGGTIFHPSCTCTMGPATNPQAVVDARLRVHGLESLRVADASIMPAVVSGNTNAPTIMIGEKAAAMIREDARMG